MAVLQEKNLNKLNKKVHLQTLAKHRRRIQLVLCLEKKIMEGSFKRGNFVIVSVKVSVLFFGDLE